MSRNLLRIRTAAYWIAPSLLALVLYWPGLTCWFQKDDFVWLGLRNSVHNWHDLRWALFTPLAQGTIRILSERIFFLTFTSVFGLNALPYRLCAFLTFSAALVFTCIVCTRLTGSRAAGFWAAVLLAVNGAEAFVLSWTAVYHEILCALNFLVSLWLFLRYVETGRRRFYVAQWITFLVGFAILELNVVYPALVAVYALLYARHAFWKTLPMFGASAVFSVAHLAVAPLLTSGPYKMFWDSSVFGTLWTYWKWALGPNQLIHLGLHPSPFRSSLTLFLTLGLIGFLAWKLRQRQWVAAFFPAWFVIVLSPLLPLRNHIDGSYLTIPLFGLAMWGAWGLVSGWRAHPAARVAAVVLLIVYAGVAIPVGRVNTLSFYNRSQRIRTLVQGVVGFSRQQPDKLILLDGVDTDLFWSAVYDRPFRLYGIREPLLVPENRAAIAPDVQLENPSEFFADAAEVKKLLDEGRALVLDTSGGLPRDRTADYRARGSP